MKYAPSGDQFASVGSDAKIFLHDGKTGDTLAEITDSPHKGSIVSLNLFILFYNHAQQILLDGCLVES